MQRYRTLSNTRKSISGEETTSGKVGRVSRLVRQAGSSIHPAGPLLREAAGETSSPLHAVHLVKLSAVATKAAEPLRRLSRRLEVRGA